MRKSHVFTAIFMDTLVSIEIVSHLSVEECSERVERAFSWFESVEKHCSRFDPGSELRTLCGRAGAPVVVSPLLYSVIEFALTVARESHGAFDPTLGHALESKGFNQNYLTGERFSSSREISEPYSFRDVVLDRTHRSVTLLKPMLLDLGAVAKGFAMDLAAQELKCFEDFALNAGGDVLVRGMSLEEVPWRIGIQHPRQANELLDVVSVSDRAVCTSGDYERLSPAADGGHHIFEPRSGRSATEAASVTTIAETAMLADALSTAAFVLGPVQGIRLLERQGVDGLIVTPKSERYATAGFSRYRA
ncbi:MAG TPA: FAD:protein FMN transferase [Nitrospira sp.]|nr:FAD:protein FMN transferase [Nitrospira sp.]